jgi:hypothetical protein
VFERQERAALAREIRAQLSAFAGAVIVAVSYIHDMPPNAPEFKPSGLLPASVKEKVPDGLRRWSAAYTWVSQQTQVRKRLGDRPFLNVDNVVLTGAPLLVLPLPTALREMIDDTLTYVRELSKDRSDELKAKWPEIHRRFFDVVHERVADADQVLRALGKTPSSSAD